MLFFEPRRIAPDSTRLRRRRYVGADLKAGTAMLETLANGGARRIRRRREPARTGLE